MNDSALPRLILGIAMLVLGGLLTLYSLASFWNGWWLWRGTNALINARQAEFLGRNRVAVEQQQRAAGYHRHPATASAAIDPDAPDALREVNRLISENRGHSRDLRLLRDYVALRAGEAVTLESGNTINHQLLQVIQEYQQPGGRSPLRPLPFASGSQAPDASILRLALEWRIRKAWELGDGDSLRSSVGQLALLYPQHPAVPYLRILTTFEQEGDIAASLQRVTGNRAISDRNSQAALLRAASRIFPHHRSLAEGYIPSSQRTGAELIASMLSEEAPPEDIVREAIRSNNDDILASVAVYCLERERIDLLSRLAEHGSEGLRSQLMAIVASKTLDFSTLRRLGRDVDALRPQPLLLHSGRDWLSFHLSDSHGRIPSAAISVRINGTAVSDEHIQRIGSLWWIAAPGPNRITLELSLANDTIFSQEMMR